MDFGGRKQIFRALVGSHNYNMNTAESDKDYKVFVAPTFDDLYFNIQYTKSFIGDTEDFDVHDIRKISNLWWKANVNFLEVLFSVDWQMAPELSTKLAANINTIIAMRNDLARMNLPALYDACIGMHLTKQNQIDKGTEGTRHLVAKYGYDTKQAMHSLRILEFLGRFADNNFTDFKKAIWYNTEEPGRIKLLAVKDGQFTKAEYYHLAEQVLAETKETYAEIYKYQIPNQDIKQKLIALVKDIVKSELCSSQL